MLSFLLNTSPMGGLVLSVGFLGGLAILLFGAPFLPLLRPWAVAALLFLSAGGLLFVTLVVVVTLFIAFKKNPESSENEDLEEEEKDE